MTNTDLENALKVMIGSLEALKMYFGTLMLWSASPSKLPYGYTELEYISSTADGGLYINTGDTLFSEVADIDVEIKYNIKGPGLICTTANNSQKFYTIFSCMREVSPWPGIVIRTFYGSYEEISNQTNNTNPIITNSTKYSGLNEILEFLYSFEISNNGTHNIPVTLFTSLDSDSNLWRMAEADLYYVKYSRNNEVIRELIPAKNSNNVAGLYDTVNDVFFTSLGNSNFVAGPEVVTEEENNNGNNNELDEEFILPYDCKVEYLESTGILYINTGIIANPGEISFTVDCTINNNSGSSVYVKGGLHYIYNSSGNGIRTGGSSYIPYISGDRVLITAYYDDLNKRVISIDNSIVTGSSYNASSGEFVLLRVINESNCIGRIYGAKVYLNSILVRDLIPVRVNQTGYMYDKVTKQLFGNNGTGDFVLGPDKTN